MRLDKFLILYISVCVMTFLACLPARAFDIEKDVIEYKLDNGMRWLLVVRHRAPVFSGIVLIRTGGADEEPGKTGLAHVFEHIAFKGTSKLGTKDFAKEKPILDEIERVGEAMTKAQQRGDTQSAKDLEKKLKELSDKAVEYQIKNEVWEVMVQNGASDLNAYTSKDATAFHASMPINRLELWMDVISQIINDPAYREFYTERNVILEERRSGVDNDPDGKMAELLVETAFEKGPYHWPVIGEAKDIAGLTIADARAFHARHYVAGNMVGVLVGDFRVHDAKRLIRKYFSTVPPSDIAQVGNPIENRGGGTKKFSFDAEPAAIVAYHKPTLPNPDEFVFDVIEVLLCDGPTSRLEKRFIYDEKIARDIYCSDNYPGSRLNNLLLVWAEPNRPHGARELASKIMDEMNRLKTEPASEEEISRVRSKVTAGILFSLEKNFGLALSLAEFEAVIGDWRLIAKYPKFIEQITADDVMRAAKQYFTKENVTEILRLKK